MTSVSGIGSGNNAIIADEHAVDLTYWKAALETPALTSGREISMLAELGNVVSALAEQKPTYDRNKSMAIATR